MTDEATPDRIAEMLDAARRGYTDEQMQEAFDLVKDADHWKNPIDRIVDRKHVDVLDVAITWYTGMPAFFEDVDDPAKVRVTCDGYFAGPCN